MNSDCLSIYADQNVYGHMLAQRPSDWRGGNLASVLLEAQRSGIAQLWVGPTNVIETVQASDVGHRRRLAGMMLELAENRRMWSGHEFEALSDFFEFLRQFAPDAVRFPEFMEHHQTTMRQIWLGALALIAATGALHTEPLVEELKKLKATNRLMHARFAVNPDAWVNKMITVVDGFKTTDANMFEEFEHMTLTQLESEIAQLEGQARRLDGKALAKLNKNRARIARAYGAVQVGAILTAVFRLPMEMQLVFNVPHIVERWPVIQERIGCPPLPNEITGADQGKLATDARLTQTVLQQSIFASAHIGLPSTEISHQAILLDLQKCINDKVVPTGGLTFDGDHASAVLRFNVFICQDTNLAGSLKTIARSVEEKTEGRWKPQIVTNEHQLSRVIENRQRILNA